MAYRASFITETLLKIFVKLSSATLINILTQRQDIPELLFSKCTPENIFALLDSLLTDESLVKSQRLVVEKAMTDLGSLDLNPNIRAARSTLRFLFEYDR